MCVVLHISATIEVLRNHDAMHNLCDCVIQSVDDCMLHSTSGGFYFDALTLIHDWVASWPPALGFGPYWIIGPCLPGERS